MTYGAPAAVAYATNIVIDTLTLPPNLIAPTNGIKTTPLQISYTLPETAQAGSVKLTFASTSLVAVLTLTDSTNQSFSWNLHTDPMALPQVVTSSISFLPDGNYTVTLHYQDELGNPAASSAPVSITVDTVTQLPLLISPVSNSTYTNIPVQFYIPEQPLSGSIALIFAGPQTGTLVMVDGFGTNVTFSWDPHTNPAATVPQYVFLTTLFSLTDGVYSVTMSYQDHLSNPAATVTATGVRILAPPATTDVIQFSVGTNVVMSCFGKETWLPSPMFATNLLEANPWTVVSNSVRVYTNGIYTLRFDRPALDKFFLRTITEPAP